MADRQVKPKHMANPSTPPTLFAYAFFIVVAIVMMGVALGTTHWVELEVYGITVSFGLFKVCIDGKCEDYEDTSSYALSHIDVVKAMCITAVALYGSTVAIICHLAFVNKMLVQSKNHGMACVGIGICAAIVAWAGVGHFTTKLTFTTTGSDYWSYGYSIYLASVSGFVSIVAGVLAIIGVGHLFNTQHMPGVVMQPPVQQPYPGVQTHGMPMYPQHSYPNTGAFGSQSTVVVNPNDIKVVTGHPPRY